MYRISLLLMAIFEGADVQLNGREEYKEARLLLMIYRVKKLFPLLAIMLMFSLVASAQTNENKARLDQAINAAKGTHKEKSKTRRPVNINESYVGCGLQYVMALGNSAPLKNAANVHFVAGFPIRDNSIALEAQLNFDLMNKPNKEWYSLAYDIPQSQLQGGSSGFYSDLTFGVYPLVVNSKRITVSVGPFAGGTFAAIAQPFSINSTEFSTPSAFSYCYGLKAALFVGEHFAFSTQYTGAGITAFKTAYPSYPVSFNAFRIGVTWIAPSEW